ncbi:hypothetical protein [Chloroflexus sp.]|uniref:hypothetical protein n=1 Tax=Chloroflexus sp. TaxID=1904827 RepID=UPI002ADE0790|nr:hypothetical protein [Chloroflexus sp.]
MKLLGRILIILGIAWLIVLGMNWLVDQHRLPVNSSTFPAQFAGDEFGEEFRLTERGEGLRRVERGDGEFGGRGEHIAEAPSPANAGDLLDTLVKIGIITVIVVAIDQVIRFFQHRLRRQAAPAI